MLTLVTVCVALVGAAFAGCQVLIAREKLRQEWFDRRYAVYLSFQRLLLIGIGMPPPGYGKGESQKLIEEAFVAKTQAVFLFRAPVHLQLEVVCEEACRTIRTFEGMPIMTSSLEGQQQADYWKNFEQMRRDLKMQFAPLHVLFEPYLKPSMLITGRLQMRRRRPRR